MRYTHFKTLVVALALAMGAAAQPGTSATFRSVQGTSHVGIPRVAVLPLFGKPGGIIYLTATPDSGLYVRHNTGTYWIKVGPGSGGVGYMAGNGIKFDGSTIRWADTIPATTVELTGTLRIKGDGTVDLGEGSGLFIQPGADAGTYIETYWGYGDRVTSFSAGKSGIEVADRGTTFARKLLFTEDGVNSGRIKLVGWEEDGTDKRTQGLNIITPQASFVGDSTFEIKAGKLVLSNTFGDINTTSPFKRKTTLSRNLNLIIDSTTGEVFTATLPTAGGTTYTAGAGIKALGANSVQTGVIRLADTLSTYHPMTLFGAGAALNIEHDGLYAGTNGSAFGVFKNFAYLSSSPNIGEGGAMFRAYPDKLQLSYSVGNGGTSGFSAFQLKQDSAYLLSSFSGSDPQYKPSTNNTAKYKVMLLDSISGAIVTTAPANIGGGGGMVYPAAGIPVSTGTAWAASITNNSANWNTAFGWGNHATAGYATSAGLTAGLATKENSLGSGTTSQWLRGDKTWTTVPNFANADLTATSNRSHNWNNFDFLLQNATSINLQTAAGGGDYGSLSMASDATELTAHNAIGDTKITLTPGYGLEMRTADSLLLKGNAGAPYNRTANTTSNYAVMLLDKTSGAVVHDNIKRYRTQRLTVAQRDALTGLEEGDEIFNTDYGWKEFYDNWWGWMPVSESVEWKQRFGFAEFTDIITAFPANGTGNGWTGGTTGGTGAAITYNASGDLNRQGIATAATGTTATGRAGFAQNNNISYLGNGRNIFVAGVRPQTLSTSAERYAITVGHSDNATGVTSTDGVYFLYDEGGVHTGSTASPNWQIVTSSNGSRTFANTGVAVSTTAFVDLEIRINDNSTEARFYINGAEVTGSPITTNIPSGTARATNLNVQIYKSVGGTARTMQIDYIGYKQKLSTPKF